MGIKAGDISVEIMGENRHLKSSLSDSRKDLDKFATNTEKSSKKAESRFRRAMRGMGAAAKKTGAMIKAAVGPVLALIAAGGAAVRFAAKQEEAELKLASAMARSGQFTREAYNARIDYASALQKESKFGDEVIMAAQEQLVNYGLQGDALDRATKATADLAEATGMDLVQASKMVGRSIDTGTNALSRHGIEMDGVAGSTERAESALQSIEKRFGGSAQAAAKTFSGRLAQLKNDAGDLVEQIGFFLMPVFEFLIRQFQFLVDNAFVFRQGIALLGMVLLNSFAKMIDGVNYFRGTWIKLAAILDKVMFDAIGRVIDILGTLLSRFQTVASALGLSGVADRIGKARESLEALADASRKAGDESIISAKETTDAYGELSDKIRNSADELIRWGGESRDTGTAADNAADFVEGLGGNIEDTGNKAADAADDVNDFADAVDSVAELRANMAEIGGSIAEGFVGALQGGDGKKAAGAFTDQLAGILEKVGWWGKIIAAFIQVARQGSSEWMNDMIQEMVREIPKIIANIVENVIVLLADPRYIIRLVTQIIVGVFQGIIDGLKNLPNAFRSIWQGGEEKQQSIEVTVEIDTEKLEKSIKDIEKSLGDVKISDRFLRIGDEIERANQKLEHQEKNIKKLETADRSRLNAAKDRINEVEKMEKELFWFEIFAKVQHQNEIKKLTEQYKEMHKQASADQSKRASEIATTVAQIERLNAMLKENAKEYINFMRESLRQTQQLSTLELSRLTILEQEREAIKKYISLANEYELTQFEINELMIEQLDIEREIFDLQMEKITSGDELINRKYRAGLLDLNELELNQKLQKEYQNQLKNLKAIAKENDRNVEELDDYWDILISINELKKEEQKLAENLTAEIYKQNAALADQRGEYLDLERQIYEARLRAEGLSAFQIERRLKDYDAASLGARMQMAGEGGFSMEQLASLASDFSSQMGAGFGTPAALQEHASFFKDMPQASTMNDRSINFGGDAIGTLNTSETVTTEMLMKILEQIQFQTAGAEE